VDIIYGLIILIVLLEAAQVVLKVLESRQHK
jgi:hypothetical protein